MEKAIDAYKRFRAFLDPCRPDTPPRRRWVLTALTLLGLTVGVLYLTCTGLLIGSLYFVRERLMSYFAIPGLAALNLLVVALLMAFFFFLTNRAWAAFALSSLLLHAATMANYYKVIFRDDYLVFEDLTLLGPAVAISGQYNMELQPLFRKVILLSIVGTVLLWLLCRWRLRRRWTVLGLVLTVAVGVGAFQLWYRDDELYNRFHNLELFNEWVPKEKAASYGFFYTFVHSITDVLPDPPEHYSKERAQELLAQYPEGDIDTKVNVIAVMLESFSDLSVLEPTGLQADPYAALREIWAESCHGTLLVDTLGGGTINSERSFLTGFTYPQPDYGHSTESYVRYFARQGYVTEGSHPGHDWYYDRQNVNQNLGFDQYYFSENFYSSRTDAEYAPDSVFFPGVLELYENRDLDTPYFGFHVSYQGHSPYVATERLYDTEYVERGYLTEASYNMVNNYLGSVADTAENVAAFTESLREDESPVVLVFFGDHKPTLGNANSIYAELNMDLNRSTDEGFRNFYSTPYWIWMNDAAKEALNTDPAGQGPDIGPYYLMAQIFEVCGWTGPSYLQYQQELRQVLPAIHAEGTYLENGVWTKELSENSQKLLEKQEIMEYYLKRTKYK